MNELFPISLCIGGHDGTPQGVEVEGLGESIFEKPHFKHFAVFFLSFKDVLQGSKRDSVHSTFNAFFHRKFSSRYIIGPGDLKMSVNLPVFFLLLFFAPMCFGRREEWSAAGGGGGGS